MIHIHVYIHIHTQIHDYMSYTHRYTYTYILMCVHALICIHIIYPNISIQGISQQREHILCMSGLHVDVFSTLCIHCKHRSVCNVFAILWIYLQCVCNTQRVHMDLFAICLQCVTHSLQTRTCLQCVRNFMDLFPMCL